VSQFIILTVVSCISLSQIEAMAAININILRVILITKNTNNNNKLKKKKKKNTKILVIIAAWGNGHD